MNKTTLNSSIQGAAASDMHTLAMLVQVEAARKAFEDHLLNTEAKRRNEHGDYVPASVQDRWVGWCECWKHLTTD